MINKVQAFSQSNGFKGREINAISWALGCVTKSHFHFRQMRGNFGILKASESVGFVRIWLGGYNVDMTWDVGRVTVGTVIIKITFLTLFLRFNVKSKVPLLFYWIKFIKYRTGKTRYLLSMQTCKVTVVRIWSRKKQLLKRK